MKVCKEHNIIPTMEHLQCVHDNKSVKWMSVAGYLKLFIELGFKLDGTLKYIYKNKWNKFNHEYIKIANDEYNYLYNISIS